MMSEMSHGAAAADWTSVDDFKGVWSFLKKENPSTKFDLLACVCSFAVEKLEKREQLSSQKKKKKKSKRVDDEYPLSPRSVLNWYTPKKKRTKRPRSPGRSESDLNSYPPLKKLKDSEAVPDLGVDKVHCRIDFSPKGDTFVPEIVQTLEHKVPNMSVTVKKKKIEMPVVGLREQIEKMNGRDILLLGEKTLTRSDLNSSLSRLMMPESQMVNSWEFLTDEENAFLKIKNGNKWNGLRVSLLQPPTYSSSSSSKVTLRRWEMMKEKSSTISCVLASGWNQVVLRNQLKIGTTIQVWSFRVEKDLHLALVVI